MHSECIKEFSLTFRDCLLNKGGVGLESLMAVMSDYRGHGMFPGAMVGKKREMIEKICL